MIESSFLSQYGIRLKTTELQFDEFLNLTSCLMPESPLGQIVAIRSETDPEIISNFTDNQRQIHDEWVNRDVLSNERKYTENMDRLFSMLRA